MGTTEKLEEVLLRYVSNYGRRRSNREKQNCYLYLQEVLHEELGYPVSFEQMGSGMARVGLCVAGELKRADNAFIVPLDTPRRTCLSEYRYYPLDDEKSKKQEMKAYALDTGIGVGCFALGLTVLYLLSKNLLIALIAGWICFLLYTLTRNNYCNFTKSSASMAVATHMAMRLAGDPGAGRNAYVFVDRCAESRAGLDMFLRYYGDEICHMKHIVFLDCLADGDKLFAASGGRRLELPGLENQLYRAAGDRALILADHPELVFLMTGEEENQTWSVKNLRSSKDRKVNMKRLKQIEEALLKL